MRAPLTIKPGLYVTATPIGNLGDVTFRAVETMKAADLILCEDTRHTAKLCAAYGVDTPRAPYHEHNAARMRPEIIKKLKAGAAICLVADAGTPLISDPGFKLVRAARDAGVSVCPIPGPSALAAALSSAGAPSDRFYFAGFAPAKTVARAAALAKLAEIDATLVFYEAGTRLAASLDAMTAAFGARCAVVAREMTKLHEEFREDLLPALAEHYRAHAPKGEIVVLVFPPEAKPVEAGDLDAFLARALDDKSVKEAAASAAASLGVSRKAAYARALALKRRL